MISDTDRTLSSLLSPEEQLRLVSTPSLSARSHRHDQTILPIVVVSKPSVETPPERLGRGGKACLTRIARGDQVAQHIAGAVTLRDEEVLFRGLADRMSAASCGEVWLLRWEGLVDFAQRSPRTNRRLLTNAEFEDGARSRHIVRAAPWRVEP
jgi:hypothetical protein